MMSDEIKELMEKMGSSVDKFRFLHRVKDFLSYTTRRYASFSKCKDRLQPSLSPTLSPPCHMKLTLQKSSSPVAESQKTSHKVQR